MSDPDPEQPADIHGQNQPESDDEPEEALTAK